MTESDQAANSNERDPRFNDLFEHPAFGPIAERFERAGVPLYPVGGCVRDILAGEEDGYEDIDCTTPATPDNIERIVAGLGKIDTIGREFGTIMVHVPVEPNEKYGITEKGYQTIEITQHRGESYDPNSRKPTVSASESLEEDLQRRDFTINAMAVSLDGQVVDPFGGEADMAEGIIRTPGSPDVAFSDDPLRVARAARFAATRGFAIEEETVSAANRIAEGKRLDIVSQERFNNELEKVLKSKTPYALSEMAYWSDATGSSHKIFGDADTRLIQEATKHTHPDTRGGRLTVIAAASPNAEKNLTDLKFPTADARQAAAAAELSKQLGQGISEPEARRIVMETPEETRSWAKQAAKAFGYETTALEKAENDPRLTNGLPVNGNDIMTELGVKGKAVGAALNASRTAFYENPTLTKRDLIEAARSTLS